MKTLCPRGFNYNPAVNGASHIEVGSRGVATDVASSSSVSEKGSCVGHQVLNDGGRKIRDRQRACGSTHMFGVELALHFNSHLVFYRVRKTQTRGQGNCEHNVQPAGAAVCPRF
jgi:hypothetical protein